MIQNQFTTKHHAILSRIDHMDKIEKPTTSRKMTEDFNSGGYAAKEVVALDSVHKSYGSNALLRDVSLSIRRNDRIALIGPNGCGKTTLLRLIMGEEACDSGEVKVSSNIKIAYVSQIIHFEDEQATVLDTLRSAVELTQDKARSILFSFLFNAQDIQKTVGNLSGGERSRLKLCLLMQTRANFLILDEPTNHLDISSREWLENAVADFNGAMLFISHDRFFLNKFASKIWNMQDGGVSEFDGGFDDYLRTTVVAKSQPSPKKKKQQPAKAKPQPKAEISIEAQIQQAEDELEQVKEKIEQSLSRDEYEKMDALYQEKYRLEDCVASLYDQWAKGE